MDDYEYDSYKTRAQFFNATGRTLDGLMGLLFRKELQVQVDEEVARFLLNVDGKGLTLHQFVEKCLKEKLITNWGGVLLDMPNLESDNLSVKKTEEDSLYAYMTLYNAEDIINWRYETVGRNRILQYVIFKEKTEFKTKSDYKTQYKNCYRVCELIDGVYTQSLYDEKLSLISSVAPTDINGKTFEQIPFYFLSNEEEPIEDSVIDNLAYLNLSHYRKSADLENGAHFTGVPTAYATGASPSVKIVNGEEVAEDLYLGGTKVIYFPQGGSLHYLEFSGQGCNLLKSMMADDEQRMAILGARIISNEKKGVESAETARIHRASENSVLAKIATNLSIKFTKIVKDYLVWCTGKEDLDVNIKINTDYDLGRMTPAEITAIVSLWQSGGIAKRDMFDILKEGEVIHNARDYDEMQSEIDEEQMAKMATAMQMQQQMQGE